MTLRIDPQLSGQVTPDSTRDGAAREQTGSLQGQQVTVENQAKVLEDAAEEITLLISEKVESKTHGERKLETEARPSLMKIAQINAYLEKAHRPGETQDIAKLAQQFLEAGAQDAFRLGRHGPQYKDPMQQYLLLQYARETGVAQGYPPEVLERIDEALADLQAQFGKTIRANLETINQAGAYADSAIEVQRFQGSIHKVLGHPTLTEALQQVMDLAGGAGAKLDRALSNLMSALGACLAATTSATDKALLETLVSDLYQLKALKTLFEDCKQMVRQLRRRSKASGTSVEDTPGDTDGDPADDIPSLGGAGTTPNRR